MSHPDGAEEESHDTGEAGTLRGAESKQRKEEQEGELQRCVRAPIALCTAQLLGHKRG